MTRNLKINITPSLADPNVFGVVILARNSNNNGDQLVADFPDISGLSGVFAQLSTWAEQFTATGGQFLWTFEEGTCSLRFDFSGP